MLNDDRRTIEEAYTSAVTSTDLRCDTRDGAPRSDTDLLIAAGWSPSRVGSALLRLHTEWDGAEHQRPTTSADFAQAAQQRAADTKTPAQTPAAANAQAEKLAAKHNHQQAKLLMAHLKSMPAVREQLTQQLMKWKVQDAEQVAGALLRWWLAPNCGACHGTGRQSAMHCKPCAGTGKTKVPHGEAGKRLANWMDDCVQIARSSIKKRLHTSMKRG